MRRPVRILRRSFFPTLLHNLLIPNLTVSNLSPPVRILQVAKVGCLNRGAISQSTNNTSPHAANAPAHFLNRCGPRLLGNPLVCHLPSIGYTNPKKRAFIFYALWLRNQDRFHWSGTTRLTYRRHGGGWSAEKIPFRVRHPTQRMSDKIFHVGMKIRPDTTPTVKVIAGAQYQELSCRPRSCSCPRRFFDLMLKRIAHSHTPTKTNPPKSAQPSPRVKRP